MTPGEVARIVERRDEVAFVDLLRAADPEFADAAFEPALADALRSNPPLIDQWNMWSGDQRWTPCAAVDGVTTAWVPAGGGGNICVSTPTVPPLLLTSSTGWPHGLRAERFSPSRSDRCVKRTLMPHGGKRQ